MFNPIWNKCASRTRVRPQQGSDSSPPSVLFQQKSWNPDFQASMVPVGILLVGSNMAAGFCGAAVQSQRMYKCCVPVRVCSSVCVCNHGPCPWSWLITVAAGRPSFQHTAGPIPPPEDGNTELSAHPPPPHPTPHQLLELKKADKLLQMQHPSSNKSLFHGGHTEKRSLGRPVIPDACNSVSSRLLLAAPLHLCSRCARCGPTVRMQESRYHR